MKAAHILFCATEAGGARELIPIVREATASGLTCEVIASNVTAPLFADAGIPATEHEICNGADAQSVLEKLRPRAVILGTTGVIKAERYLTNAAHAATIRSIAVLDEWYNYALRFGDHRELNCLPDIVCVQDEQSKKSAVREGIPAGIIRITGSPALADLRHAQPPEMPAIIAKNKGRRTILFLSEPLKVAYGDKPGSNGTHGEYLGFQEDIVRNDLSAVLGKLENDILVLEKLHPAEHAKTAPGVTRRISWIVLSGNKPLQPLLWYADTIVGMCSKTLLEAAMLGRFPISYQPNARDPERCTAVKLGVADFCATSEELLLKLRNTRKNHTKPATFPFANPGAAANILRIALE